MPGVLEGLFLISAIEIEDLHSGSAFEKVLLAF